MEILITFILMAISLPIFAQDKSGLDKHSQKALKQTIELLNNQTKLNKAIQKSDKAKSNHKAIKSMTGNNQVKTDAIYKLSSEIMSSIVMKTNGDPDKMMEILKKAETDPEAFAKTFTPEQRRALREVSSQINGSKKP